MCIRQIKYISSDIRARISKFKILSLLARNQSDQPLSSQPIPSITAYFTIVHANQYKNMNYVGNLFKTVGPMLIKLEFLVLGTKSGELDNMCFYYSYWETQLYKLVSRYVAQCLKGKLKQIIFRMQFFTLG